MFGIIQAGSFLVLFLNHLVVSPPPLCRDPGLKGRSSPAHETGLLSFSLCFGDSNSASSQNHADVLLAFPTPTDDGGRLERILRLAPTQQVRSQTYARRAWIQHMSAGSTSFLRDIYLDRYSAPVFWKIWFTGCRRRECERSNPLRLRDFQVEATTTFLRITSLPQGRSKAIPVACKMQFSAFLNHKFISWT